MRSNVKAVVRSKLMMIGSNMDIKNIRLSYTGGHAIAGNATDLSNILGRDKLFEVCCGHCISSRTKRKQPEAKACGNYLTKQPMEDTFASKEYLSKALLQKVLDMELLPRIGGGG